MYVAMCPMISPCTGHMYGFSAGWYRRHQQQEARELPHRDQRWGKLHCANASRHVVLSLKVLEGI